MTAIELPGRGRRINEPSDIDAERLALGISKALPLDKPFVFFGQSMGSIIAYEAAHALRAQNKRQPEMLIASGIHAPSLPLVPPNIELDDEVFIEVLARYETPDEWIKDPDLRAVFLPVLRDDFELLELYERPERPKLDFPICAIGADRDPMVHKKGLEAWREETSAQFELHAISGDHFYFQHEIPSLVRLVIQIIERRRAV